MIASHDRTKAFLPRQVYQRVNPRNIAVSARTSGDNLRMAAGACADGALTRPRETEAD